MSKILQLIIIPVLFLVGCKDSSESWIHGKWNTEIMGMKVEMDFRPNGDLYNRGLGGSLMGKELEEEANPKKKGTWSLDGKVLTIVSDETGKTDESIITRTEEGFMMQMAGSPMPFMLKRPSTEPAAVIIKGNSDKNERIERLNEIVAAFDDPDNLPTEIPLSESDVQLLLDELISGGVKDTMERPTYLQALNIGKATDGVDISAKVAAYARDVDMTGALRVKLFQVIGARGDESALPALIEFARKTDDTSTGQGALNAAKEMATTSNFKSLLTIITNSSNASIKNSAVDVLNKIISGSEDPNAYSKAVMDSYKNTADSDAKLALLRLMGSAGGDDAADLVADTLDSDDSKMKVAAIFALRNWPDDSQFDALFEYASEEQDDRLRAEAFSGLVSFLKDHPELDEDDKSIYWNDVASIATGETEQRIVVDSTVSQTGAWADDILDYFIESGDTEEVQFRAEKAKQALADRLKRAKRGGASSDEDDDDE